MTKYDDDKVYGEKLDKEIEKIKQGRNVNLNKDGVRGVKYDSGKPRWELIIEMLATIEVVKGLTYGANGKYSRGNYLHVPGWRWRYTGAAGRHISAYLLAKRKGDKQAEWDQESGCHHIALAICSLLMLLDNELNDMPNGDLEKKDEEKA